MNKNSVIAVVVFVGLFAGTIVDSKAQIGHGGMPYSFKKSTILSQPDVELLPYLDNKILLSEEVVANSKQEGFTFGKEIAVDYSLDNSGKWDTLPNGGRLWRLSVQSVGAYSLNLFFDRFYIPLHSSLFIYTEDRTFIMGSFTADNNNQWGNFATSLFPGDAIVLEYYEDEQDYGKGIIHLNTVVHGYKDFFFKTEKASHGTASGKCHIDANCEEGNKYPNAKRATALILNGGSAYCSGTLLNNTAQDGKPYFLTANHCTANSTMSNLVFVFNYESTECNAKTEKQTYSINGATLLACYPHSDFALFLLNSKPTAEFNAYYAGWDMRNIATTGAFGFHHPQGDLKKISKDNKLLDSSNYNDNDPSYPKNTHWKPTWDMGSTEGGSSGSALFNVLEQVIGQLEGGTAQCNGSNPEGYDLYGKFSYSWTNNNNPNRNCRLDYWLDSLKTGITVLQGYDPYHQKSNKINDLQETIAKISFSPNPANDKVRIEANAQMLSCKIYAISGQWIKSETINSWYADVNVKDLSDGIYIVELQTENGTIYKKLVIQH